MKSLVTTAALTGPQVLRSQPPLPAGSDPGSVPATISRGPLDGRLPVKHCAFPTGAGSIRAQMEFSIGTGVSTGS